MDFKRLFDVFQYQLARYPQEVALVHRENDEWRYFSTQECMDEINKASAGLIDLGLEKGDKVGLLFESGNAYFNFLDFGMMQLGIVSVPIHSNIRATELAYILKDASIKICITSSKILYEKVLGQREEIDALEKVFCLDASAKNSARQELFKTVTDQHVRLLENQKPMIQETDLATIVYTSGSSGNPKGVMLSHLNIVSNIKATISLVPVNCEKRVVSFLPLSHIFERMVSFTYIAAGASIYYVDHIENVIPIIKEVRPHYFTSVPKILERMYEGIIRQGQESSALKRKILHWALNLGERYKGKRGMGLLYRMKLMLADLLVYRQWRNVLGGKVEGVVVGAAALQARLGKLFSAAGIDIREGYGLTETAPVIAFNRFEPGGLRFGTVGLPIPGIRIKIEAPDEKGAGEVLVKGPGVMLGYYNKPDLTKEVMTADGWFRTGDVGKFVHKRFLKITDRKKDIFKTSSGKYVAPKVLEQALNTSPFIEQSFIVGFNKPFVGALILPDFERLKRWCEENKVHWTAPQYMALNPKVLQFLQQHILDLNETFSNTEKVKKIILLHENWSVQTGELTPTLKLKRQEITKKYQKEIEEIYR